MFHFFIWNSSEFYNDTNFAIQTGIELKCKICHQSFLIQCFIWVNLLWKRSSLGLKISRFGSINLITNFLSNFFPNNAVYFWKNKMTWIMGRVDSFEIYDGTYESIWLSVWLQFLIQTVHNLCVLIPCGFVEMNTAQQRYVQNGLRTFHLSEINCL